MPVPAGPVPTGFRLRIIAVAAVLVSAVVGAAPAVADDPLVDIAPTVLAQAEDVLDTAVTGEPLQVVVTTQTTPDARPTFTTVDVDGRLDALETISDAIDEPNTAGVDMVQPAQIAAKANDPLRKNQWGLDLLRYETDASPYSKGGNVKIAVVDTGVMIDHPDLKGRVSTGKDLVNPGTWASDQNGHGTHVAGIIAATSRNRSYMTGMAPWSTIVPVRVLDTYGRGTSDDVATGIVWAADAKVNVINLSLTVNDTTAVRAAVAYAQSKNIVVVSAAGNGGCPTSGSGATTYPAAYPGVIGVGAVTRNGAPASFSSCGSWVDVMAPGVSIMSLTSSKPVISGCTARRNWCVLSGTSAAAPVVSGAVSLRMARTGLGRYVATRVADQVLAATKDIGAPGRDDRSGGGLIDLRGLLAAR